jgi:hypothetical protein
MAEAKKGQKPTEAIENGKIAIGKAAEKPDDVSGHLYPPVSPGMYYICWNCKWANYVGPGYTSFTCGHCWALNV